MVPLTKSLRLPAPARPTDPELVVDLYQGDSEYIVDNEFLGTVRLPAALQGKRLDLSLSEECLLSVVVEPGPGQAVQQVELATRDTPEQLKAALQARLGVGASSGQQGPAGEPLKEADPKKGGILSSIRRIWGRG